MEVNCAAYAVHNSATSGAVVDDEFNVVIHCHQILATAKKNVASGEIEEEDGELVLNEYAATFRHRKDELVSQYDVAWDIISIWFDDLEIPQQAYPKVIDEIIRCAHQMLREMRGTAARTSLDMEVHIGVIELESSGGGDEEMEDQEEQDEEEEEDDDDDGSTDLDTTAMVPASIAAVERLERVELKAVEGMTACVICLGEFTVGTHVTRMPCAHSFHGDCIVRWLEESSICPLCRFQLTC